MDIRRNSIFVFSQYKNLTNAISIKLPDVEIISASPALQDFQETLSKLQKAEILIADLSLITKNDLIYKLPKLKWLQSTWAGVEGITKCVDASKPPPYTLTRFAGFFGHHMSEYILGHIIAHERRFNLLKRHQQNKIWDKGKLENYRLLQQLTIGILGVGSIGKSVAETCKHMGMTVWGLVSEPVTKQKQCSAVDHYRDISGLNDVLANSDYIINILPHTPKTTGLLSGDVLLACTKKPGLINLGRGSVINEESVLVALEKGWISHAVLDVFETEPLPETSKLWEHPDVFISPHISAESKDWEIAECFLENYKLFCAGQPLNHVVDWEKGY